MGNFNVSNGFKWTVSLIFSLPLAVFSINFIEKVLKFPISKEDFGIGLLMYLPVFTIIWSSIIAFVIGFYLQNASNGQQNTEVKKSTAVIDILIILVSAILMFFIGTYLFVQLLDFENSSGFAKGPIGIFIFLLLLISFYALPFLLIRKILGKFFKTG